jgi:uncharacterized protein YidB (DUF937 family)
MGLLDSLLGGVLGGMGGGGYPDPRQQGAPQGGMGGLGGAGTAAIIGVVLQLLQRNGGIGGLMQQMQQAGAGSQGQSWVGTGQNMPISPDMLSQIFGGGQMNDIARELGVSQQEAAGTLAQALPNVVDRMTPNGSIPADSDDFVAQALRELGRESHGIGRGHESHG